MNALQKVKLSKELIGLVSSLKTGQLKALEKVKASKRALELVALLGGGQVEPNTNTPETDYTPLLQGIISGDINVFSDQTKLDELEQVDDSADTDLLKNAAIAAARQVLIGLDEPIID